MKFADYFENIVYNEIISIKRATKPLKIFELPESEVQKLSDGFRLLLSYSTKDRTYQTFEELLSDNSQNIRKKANENLKDTVFYNTETNKEEREHRDQVIESLKIDLENSIKGLEKLKRNGYFYLDSADRYIFTVGPKLYYLRIANGAIPKIGGVREIIFDEIKNLDEYPYGGTFESNNLFKNRSMGSILFRKIGAIVTEEVPNWKTEIFYFKAATEDNESENIKYFKEMFQIIKTAINNYLFGLKLSNETEILKYLKEKNKNIIKNLMNKKIETLYSDKTLLSKAKSATKENPEALADEIRKEALYLVDALLSGKDIKPLKKRLIPSMGDLWLVKENEILEVLSKGTMRQRLYTSIIRQMFGDTYSQQYKDAFFFSKSPLPEILE